MSKHPRKSIPFGADNFLSVLEGVEGGFAIFVGIIAGLYFQNISPTLLAVTGIISLIVNAFNASSVRYASQHYLDELDGHEKHSKFHAYFVPAFIEFVTYVVVSFIAVLPLLLIRDTFTALVLTSFVTLTILFMAGWYRGSLLGRHALRDGVELAGLGLAIIAVGAGAGWVLAGLVA